MRFLFSARWIMAAFLALFFFSSGAMAENACKATYGDGDKTFRIATGSPGELGLVEVLAEAFNKAHGSALCWVKAGSGKSLQLLKAKEVDGVMVHAPAAEKAAVEAGWAIDRTLIGSNEFYIVGPKNDPAGIAEADSAAAAYARIAEAEATFLSRGDNSGTHKKELAIWDQAGVQPDGEWYIETDDFMMATLRKADEVGGHFMTDSSTWVAGKAELGDTAVLFRGDPFLVNTYHALAAPEGATPGQELAEAFVEFVGSETGQQILREYGTDAHDEAMYNDAESARQYTR
jgi:tungstate transport system substrate-binding protein